MSGASHLLSAGAIFRGGREFALVSTVGGIFLGNMRDQNSVFINIPVSAGFAPTPTPQTPITYTILVSILSDL